MAGASSQSHEQLYAKALQILDRPTKHAPEEGTNSEGVRVHPRQVRWQEDSCTKQAIIRDRFREYGRRLQDCATDYLIAAEAMRRIGALYDQTRQNQYPSFLIAYEAQS
jgi:hypothetical protein